MQKSQQLYRDNELEEAWQQYRSEKLARKPRRQVRSSICFPIYKIHSIRVRELSYISCFGCVFVLSICSSSLGPCDACAILSDWCDNSFCMFWSHVVMQMFSLFYDSMIYSRNFMVIQEVVFINKCLLLCSSIEFQCFVALNQNAACCIFVTCANEIILSEFRCFYT